MFFGYATKSRDNKSGQKIAKIGPKNKEMPNNQKGVKAIYSHEIHSKNYIEKIDNSRSYGSSIVFGG